MVIIVIKFSFSVFVCLYIHYTPYKGVMSIANVSICVHRSFNFLCLKRKCIFVTLQTKSNLKTSPCEYNCCKRQVSHTNKVPVMLCLSRLAQWNGGKLYRAFCAFVILQAVGGNILGSYFFSFKHLTLPAEG